MAISTVSKLSDRKGKLLIPIDKNNGYLVAEHTLRMYASESNSVISLGDGTAGSHNDFLKALVLDYVSIYRKLEKLGINKVTN